MEQEDHSSENEPKKYRGSSINDICKGKGHWSFAVTPLVPSKYHSVLFILPVTLQCPPKPHRSKEVNLWDDDYVRMPYSANNLFSVSENDSDVIKERWKIICEVLSTPIRNSEQFESALNKYNTSLPKFEALHYFFNEELDSQESDQFFTSLLPKIIALALRLTELLPCGIPLLKQNHNRSLSLSQQQIACLLANAFLCTFPWKKNVAMSYPGVNFVSLFAAFARPKRKQCICEKLKSICNYFRRVTQNEPVGVLTFERKIIPRNNMPRWDKMENNLGNTKIHITSEGTIEDDGLGFLQVDFANKNIGGGVLRYGCVQEEIRFVICPELIVSRLFVEQLRNGEAVIIAGAERYSNYSGYGDTFEWTGDCRDSTPFDAYGRRRTTICVIDATHFNKPSEQFQSSLIIRELNKAYVGFSSREKENLAPVATGNWGCGAFQGSKRLKTLIQLMACSAARRDLVYYSFGDEELMESFYNICLFFGNNQVTIAQLWRFLCQFCTKHLSEDQLYAFIQQAYFESKKQPTLSHFFAKTNNDRKDEPSPAPSTSHKEQKYSIETSPEKGKADEDNSDFNDVVDETPPTSSSEEIIPSSQPDAPSFREFLKQKPRVDKKTVDVAAKLPKNDISQIFDMLDGNCNQSQSSSEGIVSTGSSSSDQDVLSVFDNYKKKNNKEVPLEEIVVVKDVQMEVDSLAEPANATVKKRITDYFIKSNK